jgi:hypothetical protein
VCADPSINIDIYSDEMMQTLVSMSIHVEERTIDFEVQNYTIPGPPVWDG